MAIFNKTIKIDAKSDAEASTIALAMIKMMKAIRKETSTEFFIEFAERIENEPSLITRAKLFLRW